MSNEKETKKYDFELIDDNKLKDGVSELLNTMSSYSDIDELKKKIKCLFVNGEECELKECGDLSKYAQPSDFYELKEAFESLSPNLFKSKSGRVLIKEYANTIKKNTDLKKLYSIYEFIVNEDKNGDNRAYVSQVLSMVGGLNENKISEGVKDICGLIEKASTILNEKNDVVFSNEDNKLYEAIIYLTNNAFSLNNVSKYNNNLSVVCEHIKENGIESKVNESDNIDLDSLFDGFNKKYGETLSENDTKLLNSLLSSKDECEIFENSKKLCIDRLEECKKTLNNENADKINETIIKLNSKTYSEETFKTDMNNLYDLIESLD